MHPFLLVKHVIELLIASPTACSDLEILLQGSHELAADMCLEILLGSHNPSTLPLSTLQAATQSFYLLVRHRDILSVCWSQSMIVQRRVLFNDICSCMQALRLLQAGSTQPADRLLCCLGCTHRLADTILLYSTLPKPQSGSTLPDAIPAVLITALPGRPSLDSKMKQQCSDCTFLLALSMGQQ